MVNKVILVGRLGRDPEMRYTKTGTAVCNFSLATDRLANNEKVTDWHRIVTWAKKAESCAMYLAKGKLVYLEGEMRESKWEDKEGNQRSTMEVHAFRVQFLSPHEKREPSDAQPGTPPGGSDDIPF